MIVDGKKIAADVKERVRHGMAQFGRPLTLALIRTDKDSVAKKFVDMKSRTAEDLGVKVVQFLLPPNITTDEVIAIVASAAAEADGVLVQMPLAAGIDADKVLESVPLQKDVDAMGKRSGELVLTPVVGAIAEILNRAEVEVAGKRAVVVGAGRLVGAPASTWLKAKGAEVTVLTIESGPIANYTPGADIIVLGVGKAGMLTPDIIKDGVVILDAGASEMKGSIVGDADPRCAAHASVFSPVPGGIGPITISMIFKNLLELAGGPKI